MRALLLLATVSSLAVIPNAFPPTRPSGDTLHPAVRSVIDAKMEAHAQEMTDLVMLVVLLEREDVADTAERIAAEPHIARALDPSDANAGIPGTFFLLQTQLSRRAGDLADAAREGDDAGMARAFGDLAATCVACHARFFDEPD